MLKFKKINMQFFATVFWSERVWICLLSTPSHKGYLKKRPHRYSMYIAIYGNSVYARKIPSSCYFKYTVEELANIVSAV